MKKFLLPLLAATLLVCACEKETIDPNNPNDSTYTDTLGGDPTAMTDYLGAYTIVRTADLTVSIPLVLSSLDFPIRRELEAEPAIVAPDVTREGGVIITGEKGTIIRGVVNGNGLQLDQSSIDLAVDTTVASYHLAGSITVALDHESNIAAPADGRLEWSSVASGNAVFTDIPVVGSLSGTLTGTVRFSASKREND